MPENENEMETRYFDQFCLEIARNIAWGMQPTVCNFGMKYFQDSMFSEIVDFLLRTARFYDEDRPFLF